MPTAQYLRFITTVPPDEEFPHPAGASLLRPLGREVAVAGWNIDEVENWRDSGWSIGCRRGLLELEVVVLQVPDGAWVLRICPWRAPGFIGRLFGRKPSASPG